MDTSKYLKSLFVLSLLVFLQACASLHQEPAQQTVTSADGSEITYAVQGKGDTAVVFIHCWTCNHQFWKPQMDFFSQDYQAVWVDLAGHGNSVGKREKYSMRAFAGDVVAVVNTLDVDKVVLVGHSMGGPVSAEAARVLGDKVIGVVGVDTFYTPFEYPQDEKTIEGFVAPFKSNFKRTTEKMVRGMFAPNANQALVEAVLKQLSTADRKMAISAMYEIFYWNRDDAKELLASLNRAGKLANINGAPTGKESALHDSVVLIKKTGHFPAQEKPAEFNMVLAKMLRDFQQ